MFDDTAMERDQMTFGAFRLDREQRVLWRDGVSVELGYRAYDILVALIAANGTLVSKDSLMAAAWPGQIVEENTLQAQISLLRKALGDVSQRCIVTVPGQGYRLVREFVPSEIMESPQLHGRPFLAVVPFDNLSSDSDDEWIANGIAEDLITELSRSRFWFVVSRSSSFIFKGRQVDVRQIGRELGARYVLTGSIRRFGGRLRVTAQLTEAEGRVSVWAERYDRALTDLFAVQDEIAHAVSRACEPAVERAERIRVLRKRPERLDAWEAWQRAKSHIDAEEWDNVDAPLRRSIMLDPGLALPRAELAFHVWAAAAAGRQPFRDARSEAEAEAREAIKLDPTEPVGHAVLSMCRGGMRDSAAAMSIAEHAVELGPSVWAARVAMVCAQISARQFAEAAQYLEILHRISPRGSGRRMTLMLTALLQFLRGEYDLAAAGAEELTATNPAYPHSYWILLASLGHLGRLDREQDLIARWTEVAPGQPAQLSELGVQWVALEDSNRVLKGLRAVGWHG